MESHISSKPAEISRLISSSVRYSTSDKHSNCRSDHFEQIVLSIRALDLLPYLTFKLMKLRGQHGVGRALRIKMPYLME